MTLLNWAISSLQSFGYFALSFLLILGSIGLPLPEEPLLLLSGYLSSVGFFKFPFVLIAAILGIVIGDNLSYWVARKKGIKFILKYGEIFFIRKRYIKKAEKFFKNHGGKAVFLSRFIIGFRFFGPIFAGVSKMKWSRFQIYDLIGIFVWVPIITLVGYVFGTNVSLIMKSLDNFGHLVFALILIFITFFLTKELMKEED